ncbi:unnamed protein product [Blepharisma stoltei]|uniref:Uncharacterized protein n=1 Tax=Blepharisma stoltei TaxID=1481888 RepID=A0AAU9IGQ5_9CILI|nr:unnamed protein product [Blepharisma stoltei]
MKTRKTWREEVISSDFNSVNRQRIKATHSEIMRDLQLISECSSKIIYNKQSMYPELDSYDPRKHTKRTKCLKPKTMQDDDISGILGLASFISEIEAFNSQEPAPAPELPKKKPRVSQSKNNPNNFDHNPMSQIHQLMKGMNQRAGVNGQLSSSFSYSVGSTKPINMAAQKSKSIGQDYHRCATHLSIALYIKNLQENMKLKKQKVEK